MKKCDRRFRKKPGADAARICLGDLREIVSRVGNVTGRVCCRCARVYPAVVDTVDARTDKEGDT